MSSLQKPKQKPDFQFIGKKIQICCPVRIYTSFYIRATFKHIDGQKKAYFLFLYEYIKIFMK